MNWSAIDLQRFELIHIYFIPIFRNNHPQMLQKKQYSRSWDKIVGNKAKGRIAKRVFQENKGRQIFQRTNISYPMIHTYVCVSGGKKCSFFGKFGELWFFETPVLRFAILPYYRWNPNYESILKCRFSKMVDKGIQILHSFFIRTILHKNNLILAKKNKITKQDKNKARLVVLQNIRTKCLG